MRRFDLGMSLAYCPTWGVVEAVREFYQNGIDAQTEDATHALYWEYNPDTMELLVGNHNCELSTKSLLLGASSKTDNPDMIGQHGEGYKVATVVLTRLGKKVKVYNRKANEQWEAKVVKSRRYNADVVVFDISRIDILGRVPDCDLIFSIQGITLDEYDDIVQSNILLQDIPEENVRHSSYGDILLDDEHAGRFYVGGLLVMKSKYAKWGYNFSPSQVALDRDRTFMDNIDTQFLCSKLIINTGDADLVYKARDVWDGCYIRLYTNTFDVNVKAAFDRSYEDFVKKYGTDAIPVSSQDEFNRLQRNGFKAVMVSESMRHYVTHSSSYVESDGVNAEVDAGDLADDLENWFLDHKSYISEGAEEGEHIIQEVCEYLRTL